jgi:hypothetical protein
MDIPKYDLKYIETDDNYILYQDIKEEDVDIGTILIDDITQDKASFLLKVFGRVIQKNQLQKLEEDVATVAKYFDIKTHWNRTIPQIELQSRSRLKEADLLPAFSFPTFANTIQSPLTPDDQPRESLRGPYHSYTSINE